MRLLLVVPWPLTSHGGGQRLARELAVALRTHHQIDVHVAAGSGLPGGPVCAVMEAPAREHRLPLVPARRGWQLEGLVPLAERLRPDVLAFTSHASPCAEQAADAARRLAVPFVLLPAIHLDCRGHVDRKARRLYRAADLVLSQSPVEQRWLAETAGVKPDRLLQLDVGWSGPIVSRPPRPAADPCRILTVSSFAAHKQIDHQLAALARLRGQGMAARLSVVGSCREPAVFDALIRQARRLGLDGSVAWYPDCADTHLAALHADADLFLFTSRSESFGLAVLDAIGYGVTPVVYPHPVYSPLVAAAGFGAVAARASVSRLSAAIATALQTPPGHDDQQRQTWLRQRDWSHVSAPLARALCQLAPAPRALAPAES